MANEKGESYDITSGAAVAVPCGTDFDSFVICTNYGANPVWIQHTPGQLAVAEGNNCEILLSLQKTYLRWIPAPGTYSMRAQTGDSKVNIINAGGRD